MGRLEGLEDCGLMAWYPGAKSSSHGSHSSRQADHSSEAEGQEGSGLRAPLTWVPAFSMPKVAATRSMTCTE